MQSLCQVLGRCRRAKKAKKNAQALEAWNKQGLCKVTVAVRLWFLTLGTMPQTWCGGLCVSSCLGKLFCSILNQRLLEHFMSLNTLHKSQNWFLPNNRTADHVFTLRALIDKYVHDHKEKIYACFVDHDSVWRVGLLHKLL